MEDGTAGVLAAGMAAAGTVEKAGTVEEDGTVAKAGTVEEDGTVGAGTRLEAAASGMATAAAISVEPIRGE
jgi:hypothetical protein